MNSIVCLFVLLLICFTDGKSFRFDYDYYPEVEGWFKLQEIPATWKDAYLNCHYEGAVLASPENENMLSGLRKLITNQQSRQSLPSCGIFTGIHATFGKGAYFSVGGTPLSRMPVLWAPEEPDNANNAEDCLLMLPNGTLADVNCTETFPYVCYRKHRKSLLVNACGTFDDGYVFDKRTEKCYKVHLDPLNWHRAFVACAHEGGHLAIINSKLEVQVLREIYEKSNPNMTVGKFNRDIIFLGFRNFENHFLWMTVHGETLKEAGYDEWSKGQPDQFGGRQDCGAMFKNGYLDDNACDNVLPFICEKDPSSLLSEVDF